uniref:F-box domain-containing protein n=1 Tax=Coccolithus braarudii TaxID=221442 RepID=A0A7S0LQM4_9EUKA
MLNAMLSFLTPIQLARAAAACKTLREAASEESLWIAHCVVAGLSLNECAGTARTCYVKEARRRCCECSRPTSYEFVPLRSRLCETCERAHPHKYGLATRAQLMHERSELAWLSERQRDDLFRQLPSLGLAGFEWFVRDQVLRLAEEWAVSSPAEGDDDSHEGLGGGETDSSCDYAMNERLCVPAVLPRDAAGGEGDGAGRDAKRGCGDTHANGASGGHAAAGDARRVLQRDAQKEHKRRVKAAQRAKRHGVSAPSASTYPRAAPQGSKRAPVRQHRRCAQPQAWESQYRQLEERFGVGLAGLSGLSLASE